MGLKNGDEVVDLVDDVDVMDQADRTDVSEVKINELNDGHWLIWVVGEETCTSAVHAPSGTMKDAWYHYLLRYVEEKVTVYERTCPVVKVPLPI